MILTSIERILKETLNNVEQSLAENIIKQASFELTNSKVYTFIVIHRMLDVKVMVHVFHLGIFPF